MAQARRLRLTYEDYLHFPDDRRWELIDGEALVTPSPNTRHQRIVGRLFRSIGEHLDRHGGGEIFVAPYDVVLSDHDVVQPDIVFVADHDRQKVTAANLRGAPTWAIEVLSDPHRDRALKRQLYERAGVPEYWILDPDASTCEIYRVTDGVYEDPVVVSAPEIVSPAVLPGLGVDLTPVLQD